MANGIKVAFDDEIVTQSVALQLKQYDALLEFPEDHVVKHEASDLTVISTLEKEEFCEVLLVKSSLQNKLLVMKRLNFEKIRSTQDFLAGATDLATEVRFLSKLDHKNIAKLQGVCATPFSDSYGQNGCGYFFTMDAMEETLKDVLQKWRSDLALSCSSEGELSSSCHVLTRKKRHVEVQSMFDRLENVALGIVDAMEYLHDRGIVLRDLRPNTIGYNSTTSELRLQNFSFARYLASCNSDRTYRSSHYTAPEVKNGKGYSLKSDVYSFGLILHQIASLRLEEWRPKPKQSTNEKDTSCRPSLEDVRLENIQSLIQECWSEQPKLRPPFGIIGITLSAMISSTRKKSKFEELRGPWVLDQAIHASETDSSSTDTTLEYLYDDDDEEEDIDFDELATMDC